MTKKTFVFMYMPLKEFFIMYFWHTSAWTTAVSSWQEHDKHNLTYHLLKPSTTSLQGASMHLSWKKLEGPCHDHVIPCTPCTRDEFLAIRVRISRDEAPRGQNIMQQWVEWTSLQVVLSSCPMYWAFRSLSGSLLFCSFLPKLMEFLGMVW